MVGASKTKAQQAAGETEQRWSPGNLSGLGGTGLPHAGKILQCLGLRTAGAWGKGDSADTCPAKVLADWMPPSTQYPIPSPDSTLLDSLKILAHSSYN